MSVTSGRQLGPYVIGERVTATESGEWFAASEAALERPVSVLVTPLPQDDTAANEARERARRIAAVSDARLLPVYGQGEEDGNLWLATRKLAGRPLPKVTRLGRKRAARIGSQLARQLASLSDAEIAPDGLAADDVVVEGAGELERAWLLPNPGRTAGSDATSASRSLVDLLEERVGRRLLDQPASDPHVLAEQLASLFDERPRRRRLLFSAVVAVALLAAVATLLAVILTRNSDSSTSNAPPARIAARIPLGDSASALAANDDAVWAATRGGALIRVDTATESVVGAPLRLFQRDSYVDLVAKGDTVWASGENLLVHLDSSSGRVIDRTRVGTRARAVWGVLPTDEALWVTLSVSPNPIAKLVKLDRATGREVAIGVAGAFAIPTMAIGETVWALGGDASLRRLTAGRAPTTIGLGNQAGFPVAHAERIWVPARIDRMIVAVNPRTMTIEHTLRFDGEPQVATAGAESVWVLTESPSQLHRIDPAKGAFVGPPLDVPAGATLLEFGAGSVWMDDPNTKSLLRLTPTAPAPAPRPVQAADDVLRNGPVSKNVRLRVVGIGPHFTFRASNDKWLAQGFGAGIGGNLELFRYRKPGPDTVGVSFAVTRHVFGPSGRLSPAQTPEQFLQALRDNASIRIEKVERARLGVRRGLKVRFRTIPKPPFPETCRGNPCVLLFPIRRGTFVLLPSREEFTIVKHGRGVFIVDATFGNRRDPNIAREVDRLIRSIRFEPRG